MDKKIDILIRKAKVSDLSTLQLLGTGLMESDMKFNPTLKKQWYQGEDGKKYLLKRIRGKKGICFVAEINQQIIGYITGALFEIQTWRPFQRAEIDNIFIENQYRGRGIGKALLQTFIKWSKTKNVERIFLETEAKNTEAIKFYQKNNFNPLHLLMEVKI